MLAVICVPAVILTLLILWLDALRKKEKIKIAAEDCISDIEAAYDRLDPLAEVDVKCAINALKQRILA